MCASAFEGKIKAPAYRRFFFLCLLLLLGVVVAVVRMLVTDRAGRAQRALKVLLRRVPDLSLGARDHFDVLLVKERDRLGAHAAGYDDVCAQLA